MSPVLIFNNVMKLSDYDVMCCSKNKFKEQHPAYFHNIHTSEINVVRFAKILLRQFKLSVILS